jgi:NAD(P)-dependent dehydrogenase (short-subunit alcohol dehydrogenase family)
MDLDLTGRVAIVTGGSDGLGKSTAKRLALEGAKVVICARREENLMNSARDLCEETEEYADLAAFLCSARASYIT